MRDIHLNWFTADEDFNFYIQYGEHEEDMFVHQHVDFSELVIVLHGHATHIVNTEEMFIKKGDIFVINGATSHGYKNPYEFRICNIMYKPDLLELAGPELRTIRGYQALFVIEPYYRNIDHSLSKMSLPISSFDYISSTLDFMIEEYDQQLDGYKSILRSRFMELAIQLSRLYEDQEQQGTRGSLLHLAKAISYMEDHYTMPLSREEIAAQSNVSVRHLNRLFQSYYHTTPFAYLQQLRLEHARRLLETTSLPTSDIAFKSGFNDSNYFTRQFTSVLGQSPRAYRKKPARICSQHE
ncbi:helix-turn-helix domain-containing protein [Paenibacillus massiliensis]|uniref:helix-turn-helix domain-containing protein n=1 Tax=Paenibacillus massiliensis TaxID=225917 RepID=UPI0003777472|nr:helix-turn-helix domain-containing protein [Paenibacillus massiliensis]